MTRAFHPEGAQLAGLFTSAPGQPGGQRFFISSVRQSTYWEVDEEGSEAAAVTTIGVRTAAV
jgi:serine protease inhibitor